MRSVALMLFCAAAAGCALFRSDPVLPDEPNLVRDQLVVYSDFKLPRRHRLLSELVAIRDDLAETLDMGVSDEPIHVYLFDNPDNYRVFVDRRFPRLSDRRALFVESDTRLTVYAHWGDRVAEDLRHEVVHGYLHAITPNLPLWLDEGIAEYFELPRGHNGFHSQHARLLADLARDQAWRPDLPRLEHFQQVAEMTQRDYAEAWLWVHFLLETKRERRLLLQHHLALLRQHGQAPHLSASLPQLVPDPAEALIEHLRAIAPPPSQPGEPGA